MTARDGAWVDARVAELSEVIARWDEATPAPRSEDLAWIHRLAHIVVAQGRPGPHIYLQENGGVSAEWDGDPAVAVVRLPTDTIKLVTSWCVSLKDTPRKIVWINAVLAGAMTPEQVVTLVTAARDVSRMSSVSPTPPA